MRPLHALGLLAVLLVCGLGFLYVLDSGDGSPRAAEPAEMGALASSQGAAEPAQALRPGEALSEPAAAEEQRAQVPASAVAAPEEEDEERQRARSRLAGRVVDHLGQPVAGARVFTSTAEAFGMSPELDTLPAGGLPWLDLQTDETDADGRFEVRGRAGQTLRFAVRAPGFAPLRGERAAQLAADAAPGATPSLGDLALEPGLVLRGHVVDDAERPVPGARLFVLPSAEAGVRVGLVGAEREPDAVSDAGGAFELDELSVGPYRLRAAHEDHPDALVTGAGEQPGQVLAGVTVRLERGFEIAGRVVGCEPEELEGLRVRAWPTVTSSADEGWAPFSGVREATPAGDGAFVVRGVRGARDYRLGVVEESGDEFFGSERSAKVIARGGDTGVELEFLRAGTLAFQVIDDASGQAIEEFEVEAGGDWPRKLRGEDDRVLREHPGGRVRYADLEVPSDGTVKVKVSADGYDTWQRDDVALRTGEVVDLGVVRLQRVPDLVVHVVDAATGEPVRGARVALREADERFAGGLAIEDGEVEFDGAPEVRRGRTDAEGVARVASMPGRRASLTVDHKSYATWREQDLLLAAGGGEREVRLLRGGTVEVVVYDAAGLPLAGAAVEHREPSGDGTVVRRFGQPTRKTNDEGRVVFEHLTAGAHRFGLGEAERGMMFGNGSIVIRRDGAEDSGPPPGWVEVAVTEGSQREVELHREPRGTLRGRITEAGRPLAGASVALREKGDDGPQMHLPGFGSDDQAKTGSDGTYTLEDVESGEYVATVTHALRSMPYEIDVRVEAGEQTRDVDLPLAIVRGRIVDGEGEPVVGARVSAKRASSGGPQPTVMRASFVATTSGGGGVVTMQSGSDDAAYTDEQGRYELRGVLTDVELVVEANADSQDLQPAESDALRVGADEVREGVDMQMPRGGRLEVMVLDPKGEPASFCLVTAEFRGESERTVEPRREFVQDGGKTTFTGLRPGEWELSVRPVSIGPGGGGGATAPDPQTAEVVAGASRDVEFRLR